MVVITGGVVTDYTKEARDNLRKFADGYLVKPFDKQGLIKTVDSVMGDVGMKTPSDLLGQWGIK